MGLFGWLKGQAGKPSSALYVWVKFRRLGQEPSSDMTGAYLYRWPGSSPINVGQRVWVPGYDGPSTAVVVGFGSESDYDGEILNVIRLATDAEIAKGIQHERDLEAKRERALQKWLDMMSRRAGLPSKTRALKVPEGFDPIPPVDGQADSDDADDFGGQWWRAYKHARNEAERVRFKEIAEHWYGVRDEQEGLRLRAAHPHTLVRGKHYTEWVEPVKQLKREKRFEEALAILWECQQATIREDGPHPASWYFEQAAIIHRRLGQFDLEVAAIEFYLRESREPSSKMIERLEKAREKLAKR